MPKLPSGPTDRELASFAAMSGLLWNERELLEHVLFKLTEQHLVLSTGATRWLHRANDEVSAAVTRVSGTEVLRAAEIEALADTLMLPPETTLAELIAVAPEPWGALLSDHRSALRELVAEIQQLSLDVARLLQAGMGAVRETLDQLGTAVAGYDPSGSYDASGSSVRHSSGPILLDEQA